MDLDVGRIATPPGDAPLSPDAVCPNLAFRLAFNASPSDVRAGIRTEP